MLETAVRAAMLGLGANVLETLLGADRGHRGPDLTCPAGHRTTFVGYRPKTIDTVLGPVRVERAYYHCAVCKSGVVPRDADLGVTGGSTSPGLAAMCARAGAALPFAQASDMIAALAGIEVATKRVERVAESTGRATEAASAARAEAIVGGRVQVLAPPDLPDMLYLAIDGTGVPTIPAATADRAGKGPDGRARTREVKLAAVFTQTKTDDDGRPVRDEDSTSYLTGFADANAFAPMVKAEAIRRGAAHVRQVVVLGDGAAWIWNLATKILPAATQIVDLYHAREHVHEILDAVAFMLTDRDEWLAARLGELDAGNAEAIVAAAEALPMVGVKAEQRDKTLTYFKTNAHRMRYAHYRDLGMFVGSGVVEAGCKTLVGQRLKLSGMRWWFARRHRHPHPARPTPQPRPRPDLARRAQPDPRPRPRQLRVLTRPTYNAVAHPIERTPSILVGPDRYGCLRWTERVDGGR